MTSLDATTSESNKPSVSTSTHHHHHHHHRPSTAHSPLIPPPAPSLLPHSTRLSLPLPNRLLLTSLLTSSTGFLLGTYTGGHKASLVFTAENSHRLPRSQAGWYLYHKSKNYAIMTGAAKEGLRMAGRVAFWSGLLVAVEGGVDGMRRRYAEKFALNDFSLIRALCDVVWFSPFFSVAGGGESKVMKNQRYSKKEEEGGNQEEEEKQNDYNTLDLKPRKPKPEWKEDWKSTVIASLAVSGAFSVWNGFSYGLAVRTAKRGLAFGLAYGLGQDLVRWLRERAIDSTTTALTSPSSRDTQ